MVSEPDDLPCLPEDRIEPARRNVSELVEFREAPEKAD
jgi:hypothetical protein